MSNQPNPTPVIEPQTSGTVQGTHPFTPIVQPKPIADTIASPYESLDGDESVSMSTVAASMSTASSATNPQQQTVAPQKEPLKLRDKDTNKLVTRVVAGALVVMLLLFGAGMVSSRLSNNRPVDPVAQLEEQEVASLTDVSSGITVRPSDDTLLVNGSVLATKTLQVINGSTYGSIAFNGETQDRTYTLPDASGVFCLDSNNCGYLQADDVITTTIAGVGGNLAIGQGLAMNGSTLSSTITQTVQTSVNNSIGSITLQGTTNQVTVTQNGNVLSLSGPQDLGITNAPTFASISISGIGTQNGNVICDFSNNCGYSGVNSSFVQGGNSFGLAAVLGTNDNFSLAFETNGATQATLAVGGAFTLQNSTDSTSSFRVMDADGGNPVLNVDTTNERVGIGTAAPAVELDVVGDTVISNRLQIGPTGDDIDQCTTVFFGVLGCDVALDVANTSTGAGGAVYGIYNNTSITPTGTNFATNYGSSNNLFLNGSNNFTSSNIGLSGSAVVANTAGTVSRIVGVDATAAILTTTSTATVTEAIGMQTGVGVFSTVSGGTITTGYGLQVSAASVSGTGASIGTNYGIYVNPQTSGTSDFGVAIGAADTQTLWLSSNADNTTASAGIAFGSSRDTNLYRSAANTLRTDDALSVGDDITVTGDILPSADDTYDLGSNSNRWRDLYLGPATLSIGTSTADYKISYDTGGNALLFNNDQEDRDFRIAGDTQANLLYVDAGNNRIGIGTNTPGYELDVVGTINASTSLYVGGTQVCTIGGCTAASGSGNYIQNGTALQTANFNIQSAGAASVGAIVRGAASQTAALQEWQSSAGTVLARITASGFMQFDSSKGITGTAGDSYLYIGDTARAGASGGKNLYYGSAYYGGYGHEFFGGSATNMLGVMLITSSQASKIGLTVRGAASQTGNLQEWQNSAGTAISNVTSSGSWNVGATLNIGGATGNTGTLQFFNSGVSVARSANSGLTINTSGSGYAGGTTITNGTADSVKLTVRGAASQTSNLQDWSNSSDTVLTSIQSTGSLYSPTAPIKLGYNVELQGEYSTGGGFVNLIKRGSGNDVTVGNTTSDTKINANTYLDLTNSGGNGLRISSYNVNKYSSIGYLGSASAFWNALWLQPVNATSVAGTIRAQAAQNANLVEWQDSAGTVKTAIAADGDIVSTEQISIGNVTPISGVRLSVYASTGTVKGLVVRAAGSQTANLQEWQNSSGTALASVNASGQLTATGLVSTQSGSANDLYFNRSDTGAVRIKSNWGGATAYGVQIQPSAGSVTSYASGYGVLIGNAFSSSVTSGNYDILRVYDNAFNPTSGNSQLSGININPIINQTGTATGITRGLYVNPTLTSAVDFRGVEIANASGFGLYQSGASAKNYLAGNLGIGTTSAQAKLHISQTGISSSGQEVLRLSGEVIAATPGSGPKILFTAVDGTTPVASLQAYTFGASDVGLALGTGYNNVTNKLFINNAGNVGIGTSSPSSALEIVRGTGGAETKVLDLRSGTTTANTSTTLKFTNSDVTGSNIGSAITSVRTNAVSNGDSDLIFRTSEGFSLLQGMVLKSSGNVGIGETTPLAKLQVTNTTAATVATIIKGASAQSANLQEWQSSAGAVLSSINASGSFVNNGGAAGLSFGANNRTNLSAGGVVTFTSIRTSGDQYTAIGDTSQESMVLQSNGIFFANGGSTLMNILSATGNVGINNASAPNRLTVNTATTADSSAQLLLSTNGTTNKGLVVQGVASQTANLQEWQNSSGTVLGSVKSDGSLVVGSGNQYLGTASLTVRGTGAVQSAFIQNTASSSTGGSGIIGIQDDGAATSSGDRLGYILLGGAYDASNNAYHSAGITAFASQDFASGSGGSELRFEVMANNSSTRTLRVAIPQGLDGFTFGASQDTNLYRNGTGTLKTNGTLQVGGNISFDPTSASSFYGTSVGGVVQVTSATATAKGLVVKGAASQSANLQEWQNSSSTVLLSVGSTGVINSNATGTEHDLGVNLGIRVGTFIRFGGGSGGASSGVVRMFNNSAVNWRNAANTGNIGITVNASDTLQLGAAATTPDALSDTTIGTSATTRKGLVIQGLASQTANLQEWQSSTGTVLASISSAGNLTVVNATVNGTLVVNGASTFNGNITVNGQIITGNASGSTTVAVDTAGAGTGASASISGNDTSGVITINTGTGAAAGKLATITFSAAFPSSPNVVITPKAIPGGGAYPQYHYDSATGTFDLSSFNALTDSSTYTFSYFIVD